MGVNEEDVYACYCIDEACAYLYNMLQPDKDGKTLTPTFIEDIKESKTNNPGLDLLMS